MEFEATEDTLTCTLRSSADSSIVDVTSISLNGDNSNPRGATVVSLFFIVSAGIISLLILLAFVVYSKCQNRTIFKSSSLIKNVSLQGLISKHDARDGNPTLLTGLVDDQEMYGKKEIEIE